MDTPQEIIKKARTDRGHTQEELAIIAGVTLRTIKLYEKGRFPKRPEAFKGKSILAIHAIERALDISICNLLGIPTTIKVKNEGITAPPYHHEVKNGAASQAAAAEKDTTGYIDFLERQNEALNRSQQELSQELTSLRKDYYNLIKTLETVNVSLRMVDQKLTGMHQWHYGSFQTIYQALGRIEGGRDVQTYKLESGTTASGLVQESTETGSAVPDIHT